MLKNKIVILWFLGTVLVGANLLAFVSAKDKPEAEALFRRLEESNKRITQLQDNVNYLNSRVQKLEESLEWRTTAVPAKK